MLITSAHNPRLRRVRGLLEHKKQREEERAFVVEGVRLAEEGLAAGWTPELVLFTAGLSERGRAAVEGFAQRGAEALEIEPRLMDSLAGTATPQGLLAVFAQPPAALPERLDFVLVADGLRDPGNLGMILRSAAAAGAQAALLAPSTTDAFAPKVVRAGMGAHFRLPALHLGWDAIRAACAGLEVFLAETGGGETCWDVDLRRPLALLVGGEAAGAGPQALALRGRGITIPMPGRSESLNAAAAASILLFEVVRQRRAAAP
jgi:TrmH family RNA methyltransferase